MIPADTAGLYDGGFRHWLETHESSIERLTGHVVESWNRRAPCEVLDPRSRSDDAARQRAGSGC